jgi:hypothetical protein
LDAPPPNPHFVKEPKFLGNPLWHFLRNVTRLTGAGTLVSEEFMAMKDAPEALLVRVEAKKR